MIEENGTQDKSQKFLIELVYNYTHDLLLKSNCII